jgi:hypothetical protein
MARNKSSLTGRKRRRSRGTRKSRKSRKSRKPRKSRKSRKPRKSRKRTKRRRSRSQRGGSTLGYGMPGVGGSHGQLAPYSIGDRYFGSAAPYTHGK